MEGLIFWLHIGGSMGKLKDIEVQAWVKGRQAYRRQG
jgi:hypothetical protein